MKLPVVDATGTEIRTIDVDDTVFGIEPNLAVVHQALVAQLANARRGTADSLNRSDHRGSYAKTRRQKGTGRARQGSVSSPVRRGGAVAHGPHPREYTKRMPRRERRLAIRSMLSQRAAEGGLIVLDAEDFQSKTKFVQQLLNDLGILRSGLIVTSVTSPDLKRGISNLESMHACPADTINVGNLIGHDQIVMTELALRRTEALWGADRVRARRVPAPATATTGHPNPQPNPAEPEAASANGES
jgi:large subunit ribosomal protein L4